MALIMVSGLPCSGRSTRVAELVADFERRLQAAPSGSSESGSGSGSSSGAPSHAHGVRRIVVVSDASVHNTRQSYSTQALEKPARASYLSAVTRALARDCITIADGGAGLNIKGFRYQLWCDAREAGVRCLSLQVHAPPDTCRRWNSERRERDGSEASYEDKTIDELLVRYEEPNEMVRWDQPLFVASSVQVPAPGEDTGERIAQGKPDPLPLDEMWAAAVEGAAKRAPGVVQPQRATTGSYLTMLESSTQAVVSALLTQQQTLGLPAGGGPLRLSVPLSTQKASLSLTLPPSDKPITLPMLQRLRRTFVKMHASSAASVGALGDVARQEAAAQEAGQGAGELQIAKRFASWLCESIV